MAKQKSAKDSKATKARKAPAKSAAGRVKKKVAGLASSPMVAELLSAALLAVADTLRGPGGGRPAKAKKAKRKSAGKKKK